MADMVERAWNLAMSVALTVDTAVFGNGSRMQGVASLPPKLGLSLLDGIEYRGGFGTFFLLATGLLLAWKNCLERYAAGGEATAST